MSATSSTSQTSSAGTASTRPPAAGAMPRRSVGALPLALRQVARDWRAGELRLLLVALALAVAALSAVAWLADRLEGGLQRDAVQLLGGDAVVSSDRELPAAVVDAARAAGLRTSTQVVFPSMGRAPDEKGGAARLVSIKAVDDAYPLRGAVRLRAPQAGEGDAAQPASSGVAERSVRSPAGTSLTHPAAGTVWVDAGLPASLQLSVGDAMWLGDAPLKIAQRIEIEPDRGAGFSAFSPRVLMNLADLPATQLVQPASRVQWRLAVAGDDARAVRRFVEGVKKQIDGGGLRGARIETLEDGNPQMRQTLDRATRFLNLVALLAALLAGVAVAIAARDYAQRRLDDAAMLRVLGLGQRTLAGAFALEFVLVGLAGCAIGLVLGLAVHAGLLELLRGVIGTELPPPTGWPALLGLGAGMTLLLAFGLPPVLQLARVPPLRVMRRDLGLPGAMSFSVLLTGCVGFALLLGLTAGDARLAAIAIGGVVAALALFALAAWLCVRLLRRAADSPGAPPALRLATRQVASRPAMTVAQVAALALGLLALTLLILLRTDLIASWRQATPPDAPNRFVINLQPDQGTAFRELLMQAGVKDADWYPMIRGRLVQLNDKPVQASQFDGERAQRLAEREFNLSHAAQLPMHNRVVSGRWTPDEPGAISVERGLAQTLGLKLGDTLTFDVAGQMQRARITSLREVDWSSMRVNFFAMFPVREMSGLPATAISAFRAPPAEAQAQALDARLARAFPHLTLIDVSATIAQLQAVLDQVIAAVQALFLFALAAGLLVLFAALAASRQVRERDYAVMRALGASGALLARAQRVELLGIGALAGFLASAAALAIGALLAAQVFDFTWVPRWWIPLAGALAGALLAWAAGWWGLRAVLRAPVARTLRES